MRLPSSRAARLGALVLFAPLLAGASSVSFQAPTDAPSENSADGTRPQSAPDSDPSLAAGPGVTVAGGSVRIVPIDERAPSLRYPEAARVHATNAGDERLAGPSGNPWFLGFAAGALVPPAGERIDPALRRAAARADLSDRPHGELYAFAMLEEGVDEAAVRALEAAGARVLGYHPQNCLRVALAPRAIERVGALPEVHWLGWPADWQKVHPVLARELASRAAAGDLGAIELWIDVFESDLCEASTSEPIGERQAWAPSGAGPLEPAEGPRRWQSKGWQEAALRERGVVDLEWVEAICAFRGRLDPLRPGEGDSGASGSADRAGLDALLALDFVQFVELDVPAAPLHEESMPMIDLDWGRTQFDGGTSGEVVVGEVDWGVDSTHQALNHFYGMGWDFGIGVQGPWSDGCGHGSWVAGTLLGNGSIEPMWAGGVPGVGAQPDRRFYNVKVGADWCDIAQIPLDQVLNVLINPADDGVHVTPPPHVVNCSWGSATPGPWFGTESDARLLDGSTYANDQLYVFSAGNDGPGGQTLSLQASAKNVLSVGNVTTWHGPSDGYPGNLASSSSRGPTADLRWGPKVCAPGTWIRSVDAHTGNGYHTGSGTSAAAPHVTALAAQLCDRHPVLRYEPAMLSAVMMAGSLTKDGQLLSAPSFASNHHLNLYGAGRVDAYKSAAGNSQQALYFWGYTQGQSGYGELDFAVGPGATRLTVVMHYTERAASAGASSALVNDLDMYLDVAPFSPGGNTGDYFAHHSHRDNTEVRILDDPTQADWRIKVWPENVTGGPSSGSKVGVCVIVTYADVTPDLAIEVSSPNPYVKPGETTGIDVRVTNPSHVASAVYIEDSNVGAVLDVRGVLEDGAPVDYAYNPTNGDEVLLGNIRHGKTRSVRYDMLWGIEGQRSLSFTYSSDNGGVGSASTSIWVDGTPPVGPTSLTSSTHGSAPTCDGNVQLAWDAAGDALSGLDGYLLVAHHSPSHAPTGEPNLPASQTSATLQLLGDEAPWYVHLRAVDRSGNLGTTLTFGPLHIAGESPVNYCFGAPNSVGGGATMGWSGSFSVGANDFVLLASGLPLSQPCLFFYGPNENLIPFGNGRLCVGGALHRLTPTSTSAGVAQYPLDYGALPPAGAVEPGSIWKFQNWYRDPAGGGAAFNLSDGLSVHFCP